MKKKLFSGIVICSLLILIAKPVFTFASDTNRGTFTFDFKFTVKGTTQFSMSKQDTKCISSAQAYQSEYDSYNYGYSYKIDLDGDGWFRPDYSGSYVLGDGYNHTTTYGKISENTYTVNIDSKENLNTGGYQMIGSGILYQY